MCFFGKKKKKTEASTTSTTSSNTPTRPTTSPIVLTSGVSVFGGWQDTRTEWGAVPQTECTSQHPWDALVTDDRKMAFRSDNYAEGRYDEADIAVAYYRNALMHGNGIDFMCDQVQWSHGQAHQDLLPSWIVRHDPLLMRHNPDNHAASFETRFCLSNWDVMSTSGDRDAYFGSLMDYGFNADKLIASWQRYAETVSMFMARENYLRVDGVRPVLFSGAPEGMDYYATKFGVTPEKIDDVIRTTIRAKLNVDIYRVATSVAEPFRRRLKTAGYDAMTEYLLHGMASNFDSMAAMYAFYWTQDKTLCKQLGIDFWVPFSAGYDARAWGSPVSDVAIPTAAQFEAHVKAARKFARENADITRGFLIGYAWNEIGEGGIMEPMMPKQLHDGDEILRAFKSAVITS